MMSENAIVISDLTKTYGNNRGVTDLSLEVKTADIFGYLGPNGAGKSTTIRSMLGLANYTSGSIKILGYDVKTQIKEVLKNVGYMPSEAQFYPGMKVREVIEYAAKMRKMDCKKEAAMLCDRLQLDVNKKIDELSLGNRKKVSIVCAMQHKPRLFIFDEPTSGLDPLMQAEFFKLILEYNKQGTTCFLSSHVLSEIKKYCNNAAIIKNGKLIKTDSVENLTRTNTKRIHMIKDGKEENIVYRGNINDLIQELSKHKVTDLTIEELELDEIFMHFYDK